MANILLWTLVIALALASPYVILRLLGSLTRNALVLPALLVTGFPALAVFMLKQGEFSASQAVLYAGVGGIASIILCSLRLIGKPNWFSSASVLVLMFPLVELFWAAMNRQIDGTFSGLGNIVTIFSGPTLAFCALLHLRRAHISIMTMVAGGSLLVASYAAELFAPAAIPVSESRLGLLTTYGRVSGVTTNPNALGAIALGFALAALSATSGKLRVLLVAVAVPAFLLSQQRSAVLGLILGILACFYYRRKFLSVLAASVAIATTFLVAPSPTSALGSVSAADDTTVESRLIVWRFIGTHWDDVTLYGWGPQGLRERSLAAGLPEPYSHAHNQVLNALVVGGALLLIVMLAIIMQMLVILLRSGPSERGSQVVLIAGLAPLFFFESPLQTGMNPLTQPQVSLTWMVVAAALAPLALKQREYMPEHSAVALRA